ncbi:hypothetical protein ABPG72_016294 [Tetrahymena utriculariae]
MKNFEEVFEQQKEQFELIEQLEQQEALSQNDQNNLTDLINLTEEQRQSIQYIKLSKNKGSNNLAIIANLIKNTINISKPAIEIVLELSKPATEILEISKSAMQTALELSQPIGQVVKTTSPCKQAALSIFKANATKINIIATLGIIAYEACVIFWNYRKNLKTCQNDSQKKEQFQILINKLKALGARTFSYQAQSILFAAGGAAIGTLIYPAAGYVVGGIIGAIVGAISSYFVDKYIIDRLFLQQENDIKEYEREIGLEDFKKTNNGKDYNKKEFDFKYTRSLLNEHPDKYPTESLKAVSRTNIFRIQVAKEMIYKHRGWDQ